MASGEGIPKTDKLCPCFRGAPCFAFGSSVVGRVVGYRGLRRLSAESGDFTGFRGMANIRRGRRFPAYRCFVRFLRAVLMELSGLCLRNIEEKFNIMVRVRRPAIRLPVRPSWAGSVVPVPSEAVHVPVPEKRRRGHRERVRERERERRRAGGAPMICHAVESARRDGVAPPSFDQGSASMASMASMTSTKFCDKDRDKAALRNP
jgi:hypothetical protein